MNIASKIPNFLTISRMIGTIFMVIYYYFNLPYKFEVMFFIFTLASVSDFFDGYLSRKWNVVSNFGKCLDPISDKLLMITALFILVKADAINLVVAFVLMGREIVISGLREFLALINISLPVSRLAKWKTGLQLTGISMCFFSKGEALVHFFTKYIFFFPFNFIVPNIVMIANLVVLCAVYASIHTAIVYITQTYKYLK